MLRLYISNSVFVRREESSVKIETIQMTKKQNAQHTQKTKLQVLISVCLWEAGVEVEMVGQGLFYYLTFGKRVLIALIKCLSAQRN